MDGVPAVDPPRSEGSLVTLGVRVDGGDAGGTVAAQVVQRPARRTGRTSRPG